jgi:cytochrome o ubiquinol oxidase subunit 3
MTSFDKTQDKQSDKVTLGFWVYLMSDCVLFAGLFATYAVLGGETFGGPAIFDITNLPFVLIETLILLTSSFTIGLAVLAANANKKTSALIALTATLILGLMFLGMEVYEFAHLIGEGSGPSTSAFLSAFFTLVGTHGLHVFFGSIWMLVTMLHIILRGFTPGTLRKLTCLALFWHFLDVIWIFIFTLVYLIGALAL